ncbi:DUF2309 domain-containing protein [Myxococcota bacterium]|nr:DUF2309 domain-containing protein [Myxococcota bacterium]
MTAAASITALEESLHRAARWLPHQGPLAGFVHTNTLSELEHLPFHEALARASRTLGASVRAPEAEYRQMLADGRLREADLRAAFEAEPGLSEVPLGEGLPSPRALAWTVLRQGLDETHWRLRAFQVAEGRPDPLVAALDPKVRAMLANGARRAFSRDAVGAVAALVGSEDPATQRRRLRSQQGLESVEQALSVCMADDGRAAEMGFALVAASARRGLPPRERLRRDHLDREAVHREVDEVLVPVVAALLDLGQADLRPDPGPGLFEIGRRAILRRADLRRLAGPLLREDGPATLAAAVQAAGVQVPGPEAAEGVDELLLRLLLARPGWAGSVAWREHHHPGAPRLVDYAALRLVLTIAVCRQEGVEPARVLAPPARPNRGLSSRAALVAQALALSFAGPLRAEGMTATQWAEVEALVERFDADWRCRLLQEAREATALRLWLSALSQRAAQAAPAEEAPASQWLCCIDDREESYRRALEELGGGAVQTYGLAGHFNLTLRWRGLDDVRPGPRHPVVLASTFRVEEQALAAPGRLRAWVGRGAAALDRLGLRSALGALAALVVGPGALALSAWRVLRPRDSEAGQRRLRARLLAPPPARLVALRPEVSEAGPGEAGALPLGLSVEEAAARVGAALQLVGLTAGFAPHVVVMGHGARTINNPHEAAYNCGACGGTPGDGNARAFAALANDPRVRAALRDRGVDIPDGTVFVGAFHDTTSDGVDFFDQVGAAGVAELAALARLASARDALERGRRFLDLPSTASPAQALVHAEGRAADLSQVRPEYGHATNALLVVGPRRVTRGLFLDRRAFLHSYEPEADPTGEGLSALMGAAVPVCAGINLEYYFSRVDNQRFGAGSKLPLNLVGLHGVMSGSLSDLRTGLPRQMVEIHEPTRLPVVVFAPRERVAAVVAGLPAVQRLVVGGWIRLAAIDAEGTWSWRDGAFVPADLSPVAMPEGEDSLSVCRGRHDALVPTLLSGRAMCASS